MRMPTSSLAIVLPFLLAFVVSACDRAPGPPGEEAGAAEPGTEVAGLVRVEFTVAGMDCAGCVIAARTALRRLDGVQEADATFESVQASTAWARYDPERITPEQMIQVFGELGYTAMVAEERP